MKCELRIVQSSRTFSRLVHVRLVTEFLNLSIIYVVTGALLVNLRMGYLSLIFLVTALISFLVARLGMAFIVNGVRGRSQGSNPTARVQFKASLLIFGVITVLLPVSHILAGLSEGAADHTQHQGEDDLLSSRLVCIAFNLLLS